MFRTTLRSLWSHKRRLISTCVAVILGVAFMSGTLVLNSTIGRVFDDLFADMGQGVDAVVRGDALYDSPGGNTERALLDDSAVATVAGLPGVAAAEGSISSTSVTLLDAKGDPMGGNGPPVVVGSWDTDEDLSSYQVVDGRAPKAPGEAIIDRAGADKGDFAIGDDLDIIGIDGREQTLRLVGISRFGTADSAGGSTFLGTTLPEAQRLSGEPGKLDAINARARDGVTPEQLVREIEQAKVAPKADVVTGKEASEEMASDIKEGFSFFTIALLVFAGIALFVGAFIISNTFSILVAQRTRELALLRAIGATRRQVLGSVLLEAGLIGVFSAVIGVVAGIGLAAGALAVLGAIGLDLPSAGLVIQPLDAVYTIGVGLLITAIAAVMPAVRATRVPPIAALRDVAIDTSGSSKVRAGGGVALLLLGLFSVSPALQAEPSSDDLPGVGAGLALIMVSVLVLGPVLARPLARIVGAWLPRLRGVTGRLARENAMRSPRRTASTASALIIGVSLVAFISIFASSATATINSALGTGFKGDYIVQPVNQGFGDSVGASSELAERLAKVPGVADVAAQTATLGQLVLPDGKKSGDYIAGLDAASYLEVFDSKMAEGSLTDLGPGKIVVDKAVARDDGLSVGDELKILGQGGREATFQVAAISDDPTILGRWTIDRPDMAKLIPTPTDVFVGIKLDPGVSIDDVRSDLRNVVGDYKNMKLQDREQFKSSLIGTITTLLNVIYGLLAVSIVIALIGIANTLSLSIHERTRELGLLRAMGMTRSQLRASVRWEAVIVALMGTALGIALGVGLSYVMVRALRSEGIDTFDVSIPGMAIVVVFGAALGVLASVRPARKASKLNVLEAIATE